MTQSNHLISRAGRATLGAAMVAGLVLLSACSSTSHHITPQEKGNMALIKKAVRASMMKPNVKAVEAIWSPNYIQHSPVQPTGLQPIIDWVSYMEENGKGDFSYELHRKIADGDFVALHGKVSGLGPEPSVLFNIFRVENGQLAEHWEGMQAIVTPTASGRSMLDGPSRPTDFDLTEENKAVVSDFLSRVLVGGDYAAMGEYFDGDAYLQHNPGIPDGLSGLGKALGEMAKQGITMDYTKVHRVLGMGNFVLTHSEGSLGGKPYQFFDLFRIEAGKIAEHWDCMQDLSAGSKNSNGVF